MSYKRNESDPRLTTLTATEILLQLFTGGNELLCGVTVDREMIELGDLVTELLKIAVGCIASDAQNPRVGQKRVEIRKPLEVCKGSGLAHFSPRVCSISGAFNEGPADQDEFVARVLCFPDRWVRNVGRRFRLRNRCGRSLRVILSGRLRLVECFPCACGCSSGFCGRHRSTPSRSAWARSSRYAWARPPVTRVNTAIGPSNAGQRDNELGSFGQPDAPITKLCISDPRKHVFQGDMEKPKKGPSKYEDRYGPNNGFGNLDEAGPSVHMVLFRDWLRQSQYSAISVSRNIKRIRELYMSYKIDR